MRPGAVLWEVFFYWSTRIKSKFHLREDFSNLKRLMKTIVNYQNQERLNTISHGIGAILASIGFCLLLLKNDHRSTYATSSILIYSITLIAMFFVSAMYHLVTKDRLKHSLRILDHINIYFLIAGTYTPLSLITLENTNGWMIFYTVWGIAIIGTLFKLFYTGKFEVISLLLYIAMGWLIVFDFNTLVERTSINGIRLLFLGGAFYTIGIIFYAWKRLPYNHFIWHLFVLGGAISHWFFIYDDVIQ